MRRHLLCIYQFEGKKGSLLHRYSDGSNIRRHKDDVKPYQNNFPDVAISTDNVTPPPDPNGDQQEPSQNEDVPIAPDTEMRQHLVPNPCQEEKHNHLPNSESMLYIEMKLR